MLVSTQKIDSTKPYQSDKKALVFTHLKSISIVIDQKVDDPKAQTRINPDVYGGIAFGQ